MSYRYPEGWDPFESPKRKQSWADDRIKTLLSDPSISEDDRQALYALQLLNDSAKFQTDKASDKVYGMLIALVCVVGFCLMSVILR